MAEFDPNLNADNLRRVNQEAEVLNRTLLGIDDALKIAAQSAATLTGDSEAGFMQTSNATKSLAKELSSLTKDQLKGLDKSLSFKKKLIKLDGESAARQAKIKNLQEEMNTLLAIGGAQAEKEADALADVLIMLQEQESAATDVKKQFEGIAKTADKIKKANPFEGLSDLTKDIPIVGKLFKGMSGAADHFNKKLVEGNSKASAMGSTFKQIGGDMLKAAASFTIGLAVSGVKRLDETAVSLGKNLDISYKAGVNLQKSLIHAANEVPGLTANNLSDSLLEANKYLGTTGTMTTDTLVSFATLTKHMGLAADEASKLNKFSLATGQSLEDYTSEAVGTVKVLNAQNKTAIDYRGILKDVSSMSNAVKLSTKAQGYNLAEAAYQAKKMGMSMGQLDGIAGGLLDFEQSIAAELEAELLLGKDLNLEKARAFALNNDLVGMGKELQKQGVTAKKFADMDRITQESTAKALGMSRQSMADMFVEQEALAKMSKVEGDNLDEKIQNELKRINLMSDEGEKAKALKKLKADTGKAEFIDQQNLQSLQAKASEAMVKAADTLAAAIPTGAFESMQETMDKILQAVQLLAAVLAGLSLVSLVGQAKNLINTFKKVKQGAQNISNAMKPPKPTSTSTPKPKPKGNMFSRAYNTVKSTASNVASSVKSGASTAYKGVKGAVSTAATAVGNTAVGKAVKSGAGAIMSGGKQLYSKAAGWVGSALDLGKKAKNYLTKKTASLFPKMIRGVKGPLRGVLTKIPVVGSIIEAIFTGMDVNSIAKNQDMTKQEMYSGMGKSVISGGLGLTIGSLAAGAVSSLQAIGIPGWLLAGAAYMGGDWLGRTLGGAISDHVGGPAIGKGIFDLFYGGGENVKPEANKEPPKMATGGIVTGATTAIIGEAGPEAVVPLNEFYAKFDELIAAVNKGGVVMMDGNQVGTALGMASYKTQ